MRENWIQQCWVAFLVLLLTSFLGNWSIVFADEEIEVSSQPDIEEGREIYEAHCLTCHGAQGHGDESRAPTLVPSPGNLVSKATVMKTDDELFAIITKGIPDTAMQGWKDQLSIDDRRNVLAYLRSLAFP